jgi:hypothetical protein
VPPPTPATKTTPPPAAPKSAAAPATPAPTKPGTPAPAPTTAPGAGPTPSATLNNLAQAPVNAINKAQDAVTARRDSGQARVDALLNGEEPPAKPATAAPKAAAPAPATAPRTGGVSTAIAPGITASSSDIESAAEASPAFRAFVAAAKITGLFQGASPRVMLNSRLTRVGDTVDNTLGITFEGYDAVKKQLIFKDKSGATVYRRYP